MAGKRGSWRASVPWGRTPLRHALILGSLALGIGLVAWWPAIHDVSGLPYQGLWEWLWQWSSARDLPIDPGRAGAILLVILDVILLSLRWRSLLALLVGHGLGVAGAYAFLVTSHRTPADSVCCMVLGAVVGAAVGLARLSPLRALAGALVGGAVGPVLPLTIEQVINPYVWDFQGWTGVVLSWLLAGLWNVLLVVGLEATMIAVDHLLAPREAATPPGAG